MDAGPVCERIGIIMAGGSGERFWPLSRRDRPKQLLKLVHEDRTLLEDAVQQLLPLIPAERLLIATGEHLRDPILAAGLPVPPENVVAEPCKRNTAGCLAYVGAHLLNRFADDADRVSMVVTAADLPNWDPERYRACVETALEAVEQEPALAVFGVSPTRAETGYGYIEAGEGAGVSGDITDRRPLYEVRQFREKPDQATAEEFLAGERFFWNSGMFAWRLSTFLAELDVAQPEIARAVDIMAEALGRGDEARVRRVFEGLPNLSIDHALMEHARNVVMVQADFPWDDISSWESLARHRGADADGNVVAGGPVVVDSRNCVIHNEPGAERMAVGVVGADDLLVVVTDDAVLVAPRDRAQDVREVVEELRRRGASQV